MGCEDRERAVLMLQTTPESVLQQILESQQRTEAMVKSAVEALGNLSSSPAIGAILKMFGPLLGGQG